MTKEVLLRTAGSLLAGLILLLLAAVWDGVRSGGLIAFLGGATSDEVKAVSQEVKAVTVVAADNRQGVSAIGNRRLSCETLVAEEHQSYRECKQTQFELTRWCSGDCNADDAKATICCRYLDVKK